MTDQLEAGDLPEAGGPRGSCRLLPGDGPEP